MRNILSFLFLITTLFSFSQVSYYTFTQSSGTYTPITGGANYDNFTSWSNTNFLDDNSSAALESIGFNFVYNGTTYTQFAINTNGFITLGALPVNNYSALSSTVGSDLITPSSNNVISAMCNDLIGRGSFLANRTLGSAIITITGGDISLISIGDKVSGNGIPAGSTVLSKTATTVTISANATTTGTGFHFRFSRSGFGIRFQTIGTSPNRTLVVQWTGWQRYTTTGAFGELYNFQIRLNETSNTINTVYNILGPTSVTNTTFQVGLRGNANTDFNNRTTTTNWSSTTAGTLNSSTVRLSSTVKPTSGLTYTWTPPVVPSNDACVNATLLTLQCPGSTAGTNGTTIGSITTDGLSNPSCDNIGTIRDVWYSFTTGNNTEVNLNATLGTATWLGVEIYTSCGTLATGLNTGGNVGVCDFNILSPNPTNITGLAMNTTYRLRIFTNVSYDTPGTFTIYLNTVNNTSTLSSASGTNNQTLCQNNPITNITYNTKGATGATFTGLPTGVSGSWSSNIITISGTPTVSGTFNYTATLTGGCGTVTSNGTITVNPVVSTISTISGNSVIIAGTTEVYSIPSDPNATTYQWDYKESASGSWITNVSNTTSASIDWSLTTTSGAEVLVTVTNGCGSQSKNLTIYVDGVLPIELLSFTGKVIDSRNVLLEWSTASEQSNDYFIIERSTDGYDWTQIKNIDGSGNSNTKINYTTIDNSAPRTIVYYRLSQVDFDGVSETFNPIDVNLKLIDKNCDYVFYDLNGKLIDINTVSSGVYLKSCGGETIKIWKY
jgi:hypothetical protein